MTTTGASVLTDIAGPGPHDGDVAAVHPMARRAWGSSCSPSRSCRGFASAARQLLESELPGPEIEPLAASIRDTARRLWLVYVGLTALMILVLAIFGWSGVDPLMSPFQAVAHAFTTLAARAASRTRAAIDASRSRRRASG